MHENFLQDGFDAQLSHLIEETGEMLAAAGKTQRYGRESVNPLLKPGDPYYNETNETWLIREITDVLRAISRLTTTATQDLRNRENNVNS